MATDRGNGLAQMSRRVLIDVDDPHVQLGRENRLHGFLEVATAPDSHAALARVPEDPSIPVVMSDFRMPAAAP